MEEGEQKLEEYSDSDQQRSRWRARRQQRPRRRLAAQATALRSENGAVAVAAREAARRCAAVDAENELLRARWVELAARLRSLNDDVQLQAQSTQEAAPPPPQPQPSTCRFESLDQQ